MGLTDQKVIFERFPEFTECFPKLWSEKKKNTVYSILRDRLFLLDELKTQSELFFSDPVAYDEKVIYKIQKHNPKKILEKFIHLAKNETPLNEWKSKIQEWNEKEQLPFGSIIQTLRLAIIGYLRGPDIFKVCEILENDITLIRLEKLYNHLN